MPQNDIKIQAEEAQARRDFLKKAAAIGATAPAVALLLAAKPNQAQAQQYATQSGGAFDDFAIAS